MASSRKILEAAKRQRQQAGLPDSPSRTTSTQAEGTDSQDPMSIPVEEVNLEPNVEAGGGHTYTSLPEDFFDDLDMPRSKGESPPIDASTGATTE